MTRPPSTRAVSRISCERRAIPLGRQPRRSPCWTRRSASGRAPPLDGFEFEDWASPRPSVSRSCGRRPSTTAPQLQLDLGQHAEAVAGLRAAVAADPLRERTRRLLMVALHAVGSPGRGPTDVPGLPPPTRRRARAWSPAAEIRQLEAAIATGALVEAPERPQRASARLPPAGADRRRVVGRRLSRLAAVGAIGRSPSR